MDFTNRYQKLNPQQKQAVDAIEGPVMVVAGPGTGKTEILTLRIANILKNVDILPENILALTFTESGAASMKKRLISFIGNDAYRVNINTFHGFCNEVIQDYPEYFKDIAGFVNIDEIKQIQLLKKVLEKTKLKELATFNNQYFYIREIKHALEELKKESVSFVKLRELAEKAKKDFEDNEENYNKKTGKIKTTLTSSYKMILKNIELSYVFESYQEELKSNLYYDYSDMIVEVLKTFQENEELLLIIQEQHQYILVDEYQDTNTSQNNVLELLASFHDNPNIFIVGDPKQAIFRFQGASMKNFEYFKNLYPKAVVIALVENYRSSQLILDAAFELIPKDETKLKSQHAFENKNIEISSLLNPEQEAFFVASKIKEIMADKVSPNNIAVLYRNHKDSDELSDMLEKFQVPFSIKKKINILNDLTIQKLILILETVYNYGNDEYLFKCMHIDFFNIDPLAIYKIINYCNKHRINGYDFLNQNIEIDLNSKKEVLVFKDFLKKWSILASNELFVRLFDVVVKDINLYEHLQKENFIDKLDKVDGFFDQIKKLTTMDQNLKLADFINYLKIIAENSIDLNKDSILGDLGGVKLMTAHHAKGLEFDYVFIIRANSNRWEGKRVPAKLKLIPEISLKAQTKEESEERNLFYVCLTRAKKQLFITHCDFDQDGKSLIESSFINEIKEEYKDIKMPDIGKDFREKRANFIQKPDKAYTLKDKELILEIFMKNGLSATALNNYLKCPWKYFYRNLFRLPEIQSKPLIKGDAIHLALRDFFNRYKEEGRPNKDFLIDSFKLHLKKFPLSIKDFEQMEQEGVKILSSYYDYYPIFHENILTEFAITGINLEKNIRLTGKLDKVELFTNNHVKVIDFKTGKPKTRNEVLGETKKAEKDYYRQLTFYGLLLKYYNNGKYIMDSAVIDFVEPKENQQHVKYEFEIKENEIMDLEKEIKRVSAEIINLDFWDKYCDDAECSFCHLRKLMN